MNLFILDYDFNKCAKYHNDKHVVKMILEGIQLLNNAASIRSKTYVPVYKTTHLNHPVSKWVSESKENFDWQFNLFKSLCQEYTFRYNKIHKCQSFTSIFNSLEANFPSQSLTPFALCMPDQYKTDDAVESYRNYYLAEKAKIAKWTKREKPDWWI